MSVNKKYEYVVGNAYNVSDIREFLNKNGKIGFKLIKTYVPPNPHTERPESIFIMERVKRE